MKAFTTLTSIATPFPRANIDTDIIISAQYLKTIKRTGLGKHAFETIRQDADGAAVENIFDNPDYADAEILVTGNNFGCGSSREHAPWAIGDMGYRCIIAPSFADIFASNCVKNGILTVCLPQDQIDALMADAEAKLEIAVDLNNTTVTRSNGETYSFDYNATHQNMMVNGLDEIGTTLQSDAAITAYEEGRKKITPWLYS